MTAPANARRKLAAPTVAMLPRTADSLSFLYIDLVRVQQDPVNLALSSANTCLYGIVHAAIISMGCTPALGFVHSGNQQSFIYDIADLYKAELTIPLAFTLHNASHPEQAARRSFREGLRLFRLMPRIVADVQRLFAPEATGDQRDDLQEELVDLWDPVTGSVPGGINHAYDGGQ